MNRYFSIGEMAKLNNISIQTLRLYEKMGLFKPTYINTNNKYRYYTEQQIIFLNVIKYLKNIGTPLLEIKKLIEGSSENMYEFLHNQEEIIDQKIRELEKAKTLLRQQKIQLGEQLQLKQLDVVIKRRIMERQVIVVKCTEKLSPYDMIDLYMRKLGSVMESKGGLIPSQYGCIYELKDYKNTEEIEYQAMFSPVVKNSVMLSETDEISLLTIPEGDYVTIAFQFSPRDYMKPYHKLYHYLLENQIKTQGKIYEFSAPNRFKSEGEVDLIAEIQILMD
jgi:DNA-binding transcriptional MerR regulator